jgi:hypothetical protein
MAILLIGEKEKAEINAAIGRARKRPVPFDFVRDHALPDRPIVKLADRKPGYRRPTKPEQVLIPIGYRAAVSFEEQPSGLAMHLSISVERADPKWVPSVESVIMIALEFGIDFATAREEGLVWQEEYEPGRFAINLVKIIIPRQEGHA